MLPVCSATRCSSHSQVLLNDGFRYLTQSEKVFGVHSVQCLSGDGAISSLSRGVCPGVCLQNESVNAFNNAFVGCPKTLLNEWYYMSGKMSDSFLGGGDYLTYVEDSTAIGSQEEQIGDSLVNGTNVLLESPSKEGTSVLDVVAESSDNVPDNIGTSLGSLSPSGSSFEDLLSQTNDALRASFGKGENALNSSVDQVTSTITGIIKDGNEALENLTNKMFSSFDQVGEVAGSKLSSLPSGLQQSSSKAGVVVLDFLRKTIIVVEDFLVKGSKFVYYSYETSIELLPSEIQGGLKLFEKRINEISRPVGMVLQQVYSVVEALERSLGIDPSDPLVPFVLVLGTTSTLWAVYWLVTYGGYAGDLSPELAFELLLGKDSAVLVDVRPEDLRERDGIPDLRRGARFRYADVSLPKVDGSLKKLVKNSRDLDDSLIAAVIRDLKNVQDKSKIIIMDADGCHAKGIARSLRKLGVKRPYVLHGGFKSWVKNGLRAKELKPETAITIFNEEAEAILEELKPTPVQVLGVAVGSVAALYALSDWEKTLQYIGVVGLVQLQMVFENQWSIGNNLFVFTREWLHTSNPALSLLVGVNLMMLGQ